MPTIDLRLAYCIDNYSCVLNFMDELLYLLYAKDTTESASSFAVYVK